MGVRDEKKICRDFRPITTCQHLKKNFWVENLKKPKNSQKQDVAMDGKLFRIKLNSNCMFKLLNQCYVPRNSIQLNDEIAFHQIDHLQHKF
jgi:hypothetical protein